MPAVTNHTQAAQLGGRSYASFALQTTGTAVVDICDPLPVVADCAVLVVASVAMSRTDAGNTSKRAWLASELALKMVAGALTVDTAQNFILGADSASFPGIAVTPSLAGGKLSFQITGVAGASINYGGSVTVTVG